MKNLNVAIIGAGRVGTALALDFYKKKIKVVAVVDTDIEKAEQLSRKIKSKLFSDKISEIPSSVNLFAITVQDRFIIEVARDLSSTFEDFKNKYAFHTSGALSSDELSLLEEKGCNVFSLHPNFSFVSENLKRKHLIKFKSMRFYTRK